MVGAAPAWEAEDPGVWPGEDWERDEPERHGMSTSGLERVAEYALSWGGGSGCVIRHGYLLKEWGDPNRLADIKSATKGAVGITLLGVAMADGLVRWDDRARLHYPTLGEETKGRREEWLEEITVRHLATMTAGFDDGRPPRHLRPPGNCGYYSNDTSNMLAELLTLRYGRDLLPVLKERVMEPLGVAPGAWTWRENAYRPKRIGGLVSREFASGIKITHGALARIGYLYLRDGVWRGRRILPPGFVREVTSIPDLPVPYPTYGYYWLTNARGVLRHVPLDTFWALGLGHSFVLVCPSRDLVLVRLGTGSDASHLGGAGDWDEGDSGAGRITEFFRMVLEATVEPYRRSPVVHRVEWDPPEAIERLAKGKGSDGSDIWASTWADDGDLYTAYGDGWGFDPIVDEKLSMGFARVTGLPGSLRGFNIRSASGETRGHGRHGEKPSGMLMVDGILYLWVRNAENSVLMWSADHARTWHRCDWKFTVSFGCPTFLNFGPNYAGARDEYVYIYSHDANSAYRAADCIVLARVPRERIREREAYEFWRCIDRHDRPVWTREIEARGPLLVEPARCYRTMASYNPGLRRYFLCVTTPPVRDMSSRGREHDLRFRGGFRIYDAPEPWGPWTCVYRTEEWDVGPGESCSLPTKWMSEDGRTCHLLFSGNDNFSVRRVRFHAGE